MVFPTFILWDLTYYAEILYIIALVCSSSISINFSMSNVPFGTYNMGSLHFSQTCFDILNWNFRNYCVFTDVISIWMLCISLNFCRRYALCEVRIIYWSKYCTQFFAVFFCMLWHIEMKFCVWACFNQFKIKFVWHNFMLFFVGVMPLLNELLEIHSFPHFSPTCFDILSWNCVCKFVFMHVRLSLRIVNKGQFVWELSPFLKLEYWKYAASAPFLWYWA